MASLRSWSVQSHLFVVAGFLVFNIGSTWRFRRQAEGLSASEFGGLTPVSPKRGNPIKKSAEVSPIEYLIIGGTDPFHLEKASETPPSPEESQPVNPTPPVEVAPINLSGFSLTGTMLMQNGKHKAIIMANGLESLVSIDEAFQGMTLAEVTKDSVTLTQGTQSGTLSLPVVTAAAPGVPGPRPPGQGVPPPQSLIPNPKDVATGRPGPPSPASPGPGGLTPAMASTLQYRPPGDWTGLKIRMINFTPDRGEIQVVAVTRNTPAYQAGLRNSDVILTINGVTPSSLEEAYGMFDKTAVAGIASVAFERGGFTSIVDMARPQESNPTNP